VVTRNPELARRKVDGLARLGGFLEAQRKEINPKQQYKANSATLAKTREATYAAARGDD
jgi:hypothetical protein